MKKKKWMTKTVAFVLAAALIPWQPQIVMAEAGTTAANEGTVQETALPAAADYSQSEDIKASVIGASGKQDMKPNQYLIAMTGGLSAEGTDQAAAFVKDDTATGQAHPLGGARMGYLQFDVDPQMEAKDVVRATVTVNVASVNGNIGADKTKAALFMVDALPAAVDTANAATYPAKNGDYSYTAAAWSDRMVGQGDSGEISFDVTKMVRSACASKSGHASFRLQTVNAGFYIWATADKMPSLKIEKSVTAGGSGSQTEAGNLRISTSSKASAEGNITQAAFAADETATGSIDATGVPADEDRVGYLKFIWDAGLTAEEVSEAAVSIHVARAEDGIGNYQTKAALFEVVTPDDADPGREETYPAKDGNYGKEAAVYSNEWIGGNNLGVKTFDVTQIVKAAIASGRNSAAFRLQTVISGFSVSVSAGSAPSLNITNAAEKAQTKTSYDLFECMYQITDSKSGKMLMLDGGLKVDSEAARDDDTLFNIVRYGDLAVDDSLDNVPAALQTASMGSYFALAKGDGVGTAVKTNTKIAEDRSQQFILQKSPNWSEDYLAYKIYHPLSRTYIGYDTAEPHTLQVYGSTAPDYDFVFTRKEYSDLGKIRTIPGYQKLSENEKKRVIDLLGGIGAYSLFKWGGTGNTTASFGYRGMAELEKLYGNLTATTADEQVAKIRSIMKDNIFSGQTNWYGLPKLPGADDVKLEIRSETYGKYDFWRGTMLNGTRYELVITDAYATQTVNLHIEDQNTAIANGKNAMEAIKQIPYPLRKDIRNMFIRNDGANSYNCGGGSFYMRTNWVSSVDNVAMYMTHEFGHNMDQVYNINGSGKWGTARNDDVVGISEYGSSNNSEDLADFGRLYFQSYGNVNRMYALRQMCPNRYREYVAMLLKTGYSDILMDKTEQMEQGANRGELRQMIAKAEKKAAKEGIYAEETMQALREALDTAKLWLDSPDATQTEIDEACTALERAVNGLEFAEFGRIAYFSFDDTENGFTGGSAMAVNKGTPILDADANKGKALKLDGSGSNYLAVTGKDGAPLLTEYEEITISFWSKVNNAKTNWAFYGAADDKAPVYNREVYLGVLDKGTSIAAERYKNTGKRPSVPSAQAVQNAWRLVTVAVGKEQTSIYVNGVKSAEEKSSILLKDIFGEDSILYIGKANWGTGEYFNGLLDEFTIYNYAMTADWAEQLYQTGKEPSSAEVEAVRENQEKAAQAVKAIEEIGEVSYCKSVKNRIDAARNAYEALSSAQKLLVGDALKTLAAAEEAYAAAKEAFDERAGKRIAYFTFDDEQSGFASEYAKAVNKGTPMLAEDAKKGKSLSLDGKNSNYLKVTDKDGKPLLTAYDAVTICYWGKVGSMTASNWSFFASGNNRQQIRNHEIYAGILDKGDNIEVQRYKNSGARPASVTGASAADEWKFISIVIDEGKTTLYINGQKSGEKNSDYLLSDILGDDSICYIGRANWSTGEYFQGLIDEYSIYNFALTGAQIAAAYQGEPVEQAAVDKVKDLIDGIGTVTLTAFVKEKIEAARAAYEKLPESQKALVTNIALLEEAEQEYKRLEEEAKDPEEPDPENPDPEKPDPENPDPEKPDPEKPDPEKPDPEKPDPEKPDPENPDPEKPDPEKPDPGNSGSGNQNPGNPGSENQNPENPGSGNPGGSIGLPREEDIFKENPGLPQGNSEESAKSAFGVLTARVVKSSSNSHKLKWKKVKGAQGYVVLGNLCNQKGKKYKYELLKIIEKNSITTYTHKKLKKGTYYKYIVQAYKIVDGKLQIIATSKSMHAATAGGKYGNVSSFKLNKSKVTLKKGKKFTIKAKEIKKNKKLSRHRKTAYESSNPQVATVSKKGIVKAKKKGSCYIYVYAQNGIYKRLKVKVK